MKDGDIKLLMILAFRYCLERRTETTVFINNLIMENQNMFNENDWKRFVKEINDAEDLGNPYEIQLWNKLLSFCQNKLLDKR